MQYILDHLAAIMVVSLAALCVFGVVQLADWDIRNDSKAEQSPVRAATKYICYTFGTIWLAVNLYRWWGYALENMF